MFTLCWPRADYLWFPCDFRAVAYFFVLISGSIVAFSLSPGVSNLQNRGPPNSSFTGKWSPSIILSLQNQHFFLEGIFVSLPLVILAPSFWRLLSVLLACAGIVVLTSIGCVFRIALVDILSQGAQCCHGGGLPVECDGNGSHASESDEQR